MFGSSGTTSFLGRPRPLFTAGSAGSSSSVFSFAGRPRLRAGFFSKENCVGSADSASNFFGRPRVARVARVAPTVSVESSFFSVATSFAAGFFVATLFSFLVAVVVFTAVGFFAAAAVAALFAGGDDGIWGEDCGEDGNCDSSVFRAGVFAGVFPAGFSSGVPAPKLFAGVDCLYPMVECKALKTPTAAAFFA